MGKQNEPTPGCSIEILRDIYMYVRLSMGNPYKKYICQNAWADLRGPNMCMLKVRFGLLKMTVTPILFISTIHYSSFSMDKKTKTFT